MVDARSRARVERLIAGDFRPDDLTHLFLFARDRCDGREAVQEIGDFVAHHAERTKGPITRSAREWFAIATFVAWQFDGSIHDARNLPAVFPEYLRATLRRTDMKVGPSRVKAGKALECAIAKFALAADGTYSLTSSLDQKEIELLNLLTTQIVVKATFTGERLYRDFIATLRSNGLISLAEIGAAPNLASAVQLFAVSIMHQCVVVLQDDSRITLQAIATGNRIVVSATVAVPNSIRFASEMYSTELSPNDWCEQSLLSAPKAWDNHIELKPNGKLGLM